MEQDPTRQTLNPAEASVTKVKCQICNSGAKGDRPGQIEETDDYGRTRWVKCVACDGTGFVDEFEDEEEL